MKFVIELLPNTFVDEERLLHMSHLNENRRESTIANESHKKWVKAKYDRFVRPRVFTKGDLVLVYNQDHDKHRARKFEPL